MRYFIVLFALYHFFSCQHKSINQLQKGIYRAVLQVQDNKEIPFTFEVITPTLLKMYNAEEVILVDEISYKGDSIYIQTPVFEGYIAGKLTVSGIQGAFIKPSLDRTVPFYATHTTSKRFHTTKIPNTNVSGNWETIFSQHSNKDRYIAKGIFKQAGAIVTGTFRTTTGDYRYLEGVVSGDSLHLSTFDGAHAFLFTAKVTDSTMVGSFYSGNHWKEPFVATRNPTYELPNASELTYLKKGYSQLAFSFPDEKGTLISLTDKRFQNKVVLVQIMGTWCPNCLDESKYLAEFYKKQQSEQLEIVALAFEYAKTEASAFKKIQRLREKVGITYPILLAQYGTDSKFEAQKKLPMLTHILSYPTTIFIDKKGNVRKIHTGFNGPATGEKYKEFVKEFEDFTAQLIAE